MLVHKADTARNNLADHLGHNSSSFIPSSTWMGIDHVCTSSLGPLARPAPVQTQNTIGIQYSVVAQHVILVPRVYCIPLSRRSTPKWDDNARLQRKTVQLKKRNPSPSPPKKGPWATCQRRMPPGFFGGGGTFFFVQCHRAELKEYGVRSLTSGVSLEETTTIRCNLGPTT